MSLYFLITRPVLEILVGCYLRPASLDYDGEYDDLLVCIGLVEFWR